MINFQLDEKMLEDKGDKLFSVQTPSKLSSSTPNPFCLTQAYIPGFFASPDFLWFNNTNYKFKDISKEQESVALIF